MPLESWWDWEVEITPHGELRMEQRGLSEVELRAMLHTVGSYRPDRTPGRWVLTARLRTSVWHVVLDPDSMRKRILIITAYRAQR